MKALSIRQPWAWLVVHGIKDVENRTRSTEYRGPLLIHAGRHPMTEEDEAWLAEYCRGVGIECPQFPLAGGGIAGRVVVADCVRLEELAQHSEWAEGPWCWILENAEVLPFVECVGQRGLFEVDCTALSNRDTS